MDNLWVRKPARYLIAVKSRILTSPRIVHPNIPWLFIVFTVCCVNKKQRYIVVLCGMEFLKGLFWREIHSLKLTCISCSTNPGIRFGASDSITSTSAAFWQTWEKICILFARDHQGVCPIHLYIEVYIYIYNMYIYTLCLHSQIISNIQHIFPTFQEFPISKGTL